MSRRAWSAGGWGLLLSLILAIGAGPTDARTSADSLGTGPADADGQWNTITPPGPFPPDRQQHGAIYDPVGQRMILYGGAEYMADTWALTFGTDPQWVPLTPSASPSGRKAMSVAYDPLRRRMLMFGGYDGTYQNDVWALSLDGDPVWTRLSPGGTRPSGRMFTVAVYDPLRDRLIVFGGHPIELNDVWELSLSGTPAWKQLFPSGPLPSPRYGHVGVFDPINDRLVIFGGTRGGNETWSLDLSGTPSWRRLTFTGPEPPSRFYASAVYDSRRQRMVLYGGYGAPPDVWALSLTGDPVWQQLAPMGATPIAALHTAVYDADLDRMVVYSGSSATLPVLGWGGPPPGPFISGFSPAGGRVGDPVEIRGARLTDALDVRFNGASAPIDANTDTRIATRVPDGATTGLIEVTTTIGKAMSHTTFFVGETPEVLDASPREGAPGTTITVAGAHFTGAIRVAFGPDSHAGFAVLADDKITATLDDAATSGPIRVTTPAATGSSSFSFRVVPPPPLISGFTPQGGRIGDPVSIFGSNFRELVSVAFTDVAAVFSVVSPSRIDATIPAGAVSGPIFVTTSGGVAKSARDFFVGETPVIDGITPDRGKVGTIVQLTGRHFTGARRVAFGPNSSATFTVVRDDLLTAIPDSAATTGFVSVTTPAATGTSTLTFHLLPPDTSARIVSVKDVPRDQGGRVTIRWLRSDFDQLPHRAISSYQVWRRAPAEPGFAARALPTWLRETDATGEVVFWEPLAEIPASHLEGYAYTAPTTQDSTQDGNPYTAFFVQTLTTDPFTFFRSAADSGYSVDNLSPSKPGRLSAEYGKGGVILRWSGSGELDLREYRLYRGGDVAFTPSRDALVYSGTDTTFIDAAGHDCYKLSAVDIHGNESLFALATPSGSTTSVAFTVTVQARPHEVTVDWYVIGLPGAAVTIYRRDPAAIWKPVASTTADGGGMVHYRDDSVRPGQRLSYRLGTLDGEVELFSDEVLVTVPEAKLAFLGLSPNPLGSSREATLAFSLPDDGRVTLRLFDATGRVMASRDLGWMSAGLHRERWSVGRSLPAGIYWLRLEQRAASVGGKLCLLGP